jgi:hypothetical protein
MFIPASDPCHPERSVVSLRVSRGRGGYAIKGRRQASYHDVSAVRGDHRAFLDATLPYLDAVYQVARHAAVDGQDPEDLVQETYLRAYASFGSYRGGSVRAWLAAICLNAARSQARHRRLPGLTVVLLSRIVVGMCQVVQGSPVGTKW